MRNCRLSILIEKANAPDSKFIFLHPVIGPIPPVEITEKHCRLGLWYPFSVHCYTILSVETEFLVTFRKLLNTSFVLLSMVKAKVGWSTRSGW
ncbi:hypothetical protein Mapa_008741 [Marchantia paleacea]|nr:hypothetical protein Mapa_008741 [Marchantia paleacea]